MNPLHNIGICSSIGIGAFNANMLTLKHNFGKQHNHTQSTIYDTYKYNGYSNIGNYCPERGKDNAIFPYRQIWERRILYNIGKHRANAKCVTFTCNKYVGL